MQTPQEIANQDTRIAYGTHCVWWDNIQKVGIGFKGLPCCPYCRGLLFEVPNIDEWMKGAEAWEKDHHGYLELLNWIRGKSFKTMADAKLDFERSKNANSK